MCVHHGGRRVLGLEEGCPAVIDDSGEQPFLVAEVMVERRRGDAGGVADSTSGDICVGGTREQFGGGFEDTCLDGHAGRLAGSIAMLDNYVYHCYPATRPEGGVMIVIPHPAA